MPKRPLGPRFSKYRRPVRVAELWRYPVKSLQGERMERAEVTPTGLKGDRRFALIDLATGFGLTGRRVPELLFASATYLDKGDDDGDTVQIRLPDGTVAADDEALSEWLGRPVALKSADQVPERRYEDVEDFEQEASSGWSVFDGAPGPFHDSARARVSLVSTATIGGWDRRRFRPNVLLDGEGEDGLLGSRVALGGAVLDVQRGITRCVMVTRPQPGIERDLDVLKTVIRTRQRRLAVGALVAQAGPVQVGDELRPLT
jgi:uncharacterized protein YcbX